jgi:ketosteroid isomerase-like protein
MFDVALPNEGVRGIEAYRDTWQPFFQWQASGAVFQIESLDVTAGAEVAFAYALLRCGTPADFARDPAQRLRLTLGLRKIEGCWTVTHEHHSFPRPDARGHGNRDRPGRAVIRKNWLASTWKHARINALPHLDNYQGRAITNCSHRYQVNCAVT